MASIQAGFEKAGSTDPEYPEIVQELCEDVRRSCVDYLDAVLRHERQAGGSFRSDYYDSPDERASRLAAVQGVNDRRTQAHDLLIQNMEILARFGRKNGVDTSWWDGPTGMKDLHRTVAGEWGMREGIEVIKQEEFAEIERRKARNHEQRDQGAAA